eukprot:TRINITY_DN2066_c0_g1_i1.p1 TRINITY_DN2066_c0_g1~~TRINITY_DN2066_c0_g1_i1.p1  ORF type:complete len:403 (-),score=41.10 TRINITY_DN2066_c0_g1_i1:135-1343(-)
MQKLSKAWDDLCDLIIRPQRALYAEEHLGPRVFRLGDRVFHRTDLTLENPRGMTLHCSHFEPVPSQRPAVRLPVVIYLHGNCGCRLDGIDAVPLLLPLNITVFTVDFTGSGWSEGDYVSLGFFERQDLAAIVEHLGCAGTVSRIGLWGRSMGAATSIMYGSRDPTIAAIVADSPFSSLTEIMEDIVETYKSWIPKGATRLAIKMVRRTILQKAHFDLKDLNTLQSARNCKVPILIAHAQDDDFVRISHAEAVAEAYKGEKMFIRFAGDHNSERPEFFHDAVVSFYLQHLILPDPELVALLPHSMSCALPGRSSPDRDTGDHTSGQVDPQSVSLCVAEPGSDDEQATDTASGVVTDPTVTPPKAPLSGTEEAADAEDTPCRKIDPDVLCTSPLAVLAEAPMPL